MPAQGMARRGEVMGQGSMLIWQRCSWGAVKKLRGAAGMRGAIDKRKSCGALSACQKIVAA